MQGGGREERRGRAGGGASGTIHEPRREAECARTDGRTDARGSRGVHTQEGALFILEEEENPAVCDGTEGPAGTVKVRDSHRRSPLPAGPRTDESQPQGRAWDCGDREALVKGTDSGTWRGRGGCRERGCARSPDPGGGNPEVFSPQPRRHGGHRPLLRGQTSPSAGPRGACTA